MGWSPSPRSHVLIYREVSYRWSKLAHCHRDNLIAGKAETFCAQRGETDPSFPGGYSKPTPSLV